MALKYADIVADMSTVEALMAQGKAFRAAVLAARWNIDGPGKELRHFGEMFDDLIHDSLQSAHGCVVRALDECGVEVRKGEAA